MYADIGYVCFRFSLASNRTTNEAAEELVDLALRLGSSDNVTVIVILFLHP
jgi:serine/threonine protein phosphatase PrpC